MRAARSPNSADNRSLRLSSPWPEGADSSWNAGPESETSDAAEAIRARTVMRISPPARSGAMACLTLSPPMSVATTGDARFVQASGNIDLISQAVAKTGALDVQIVGDDLELARERHQAGLISVQREAQQRGHLLHRRSARAGSSGMSDEMELSVLKRKCGWIRDSSEASCASVASLRARSRSSSLVRSCSVVSSSRSRSVL